MTQRGLEIDNRGHVQESEQSDLDRLLAQPRANPYEPQTHDEAWRLAEIVAGSALYKLGGAPEAAYVILMTGKDLGLSQSQALRGIKIVNGSPAPSADTLVAVCLNSGLCDYFEEVSTDATQSTWRTRRKDRPEKQYRFTMEEAKAAGVFSRKESPWTTYPERMLRARAKAFLARDVFPDVTLGLYTPEELVGDSAAIEVPKELESVAKWQAKAHDPVPPVCDEASDIMNEALQSKPIHQSLPLANADMLDPIEPPGNGVDWRARMRAAESKAEATRIGKEAIAADPSVRAEAQAILKEFKS